MTLEKIAVVLEPTGGEGGDGSQAVRGIRTVMTPSDSEVSRFAVMAGRRWMGRGLRLASGSPDRSKCSWRREGQENRWREREQKLGLTGLGGPWVVRVRKGAVRMVPRFLA